MSQDTAWLTVRLHLSMAPAVLCPIGTIHTLPGRPVASRTTKHSRNRSFPEISRLSLVLPRKMLALRPFSIDFIPKTRRRGSTLEQSSILQIVSAATGSELELQEPTAETEKFAVEAGVSDDPPEAAESEVSKSVIAGSSPATRQFKRPGVTRKNEKPRIQNEELVPGATFTGKVRAIQSFGAFIDFGAFTDGLVHVSRLSDSFVKEVTDVVSVGQEVTVRILEANIETGRIALTMRRTDDPNQPRQERASDRSSNFDESSGKVVRTGKVAGRFSQKSRVETQMSSKLRKGQTVEGKVKNLVRSGAFITLPDDEEGFLPSTEVTEGFGKLSGSTGLQVGQDVTVRVLRIVRGKPTLTMKKEEDMASLNMKINQGVTEFASNPFELAFRKNPVIATFLEEQERLRKSTETAKAEADAEEHHNEKQVEAMSTTVDSAKQVVAIEQVVDDKVMEKVGTGVPQSLEEHEGSVISGTKDGLTNGHAEQADKSFTLSSKQVVDKETATKEVNEVEVDKDKVIDSASTEAKDILAKDTVKVDESSTLSTEQIADNEAYSKEVSEVQRDKMKVIDSVSAEAKGVFASNPVEVDESSTFSTEQIVDKETSGKDVNDVQVTKDKVIDSASSEVKDVLANDTAEVDDSSDLKLEKPVTTLEVDLKNVSSDPQEITDSDSVSIGALSEVNLSGEIVNVPVNGSPQPDKIAEQVDDLIGQTLSTSSSEQGKIDSSKEAVINVEQLSLRNSSDFRTVAMEMKAETNTKESANAEQVDTVIGQTFSTSISKQGKIDSSKAAAINIEQPSLTNNSDFRNMAAEIKAETNATNASPIPAALVKRLREETGAAMMDCKKALAETGGDLEKARELLRKKGLASAEKKASRIAVEGRIGSYIHDSRIGVLIEVNCETDFVSRGEIFGELVEDLAMQVAASPQVEYVSVEDVSEDIVSKERELELQKEDLLNKPEHIRAKIVDGRIGKILGELALLEQPYIKNDKLLVKDWIKQTIATLGENIQVRRFARYNLGEGLEKKNQDFAAEVAAQTAVKQPPSKPAAEPKAGADSSTTTEEIKSAVEKQTAVISAALVKQLREETGAGMMDCKKALTETGGDLEKAQEFLRKKGLAGADKKSSRIAAEGRVGSYIHDSRIGVLIEVNSETDFVARGDVFKQLVEDLAMQVVACPQVQYVSVEDISKEVVNKEREIEMQREDLLGKPEQIQEKIVDGRIAKRLSELALLEQPFIKDDSILVKDIVKQAVATLGENIRVRRFIRYNLGEGLEKEAKDLSTEIAKQTLSNEQS